MQITKRLKELEAEKRKLLAQQDKIRANRKFVCMCGEQHRFKECEGIRFWERPIGYDDDGQWSDVHIICPKKGFINRMLFSGYENDIPYEERRDINNNLSAQFQRTYMYEPLLKKVTKHPNTNESIHHYTWCNNESIMKNYKRYELRVEYFEKMKAALKGK